MPDFRFNISIPGDRNEQLRQLSEKTGINVSSIIRGSLYEKLDNSIGKQKEVAQGEEVGS